MSEAFSCFMRFGVCVCSSIVLGSWFLFERMYVLTRGYVSRGHSFVESTTLTEYRVILVDLERI